MATDSEGRVVRADGKPLNISHSLLETFEPQPHLDQVGCRRKAWYSSVEFRRGQPTDAQVVGRSVHKVGELYSKGKDYKSVKGFSRWWRILEPALQYLPKPEDVASGEYGIEEGFLVPLGIGGLSYKGLADIVSHPHRLIDDLKVAGNPLKYGKNDPAELARFNQPLSYAYGFWHADPPEYFSAGHIYMTRTGRPHAYKILAKEIPWRAVTENWEGYVLPTTDKVIATFGPAERAEDVPANKAACGAYGGCPHFAYCSAHQGVAMSTTTQQSSDALARLAAIKQNASGTRTAPSPAPTAPTAAPTQAPSSAPTQAGELPAALSRALEQCGAQGVPMTVFNILVPGKSPSDFGLAEAGGFVKAQEPVEDAVSTLDRDAQAAALRGKTLTELREIYDGGVPANLLHELGLKVHFYLVVDSDCSLGLQDTWASVGKTLLDYNEEDTKLTALRGSTPAPAPAPAAPVPEAKPAPALSISEGAQRVLALLEGGPVVLDVIKDIIRETQDVKSVHSARVEALISEVSAHHATATWDKDKQTLYPAPGSDDAGGGSEEVGTGLPEGANTPEPPEAPATQPAAPVHASPEPLTQGESPERAAAYAEGFERGQREMANKPCVLYIGARPDWLAITERTSFAAFMRTFEQQVEQQEGVAYYGLMDYGKGPKAVIAMLKVAIYNARVDWPEALIAEDAFHPLLSEALPVLQAAGVRTVRGTR